MRKPSVSRSTVPSLALLSALVLSGCAAGGLAPLLLPAPLVGLRFLSNGQFVSQPGGSQGFSPVGEPVRFTVSESLPSQEVVFTLLEEDALVNDGELVEQVTDRDLTLTYSVDSTSTAVQGEDYLSIGTSVVVVEGESRASITVDLIDDLATDGDKTLIINLTSPDSGEPYDGAPCCTTAILTIEEDDPTPLP